MQEFLLYIETLKRIVSNIYEKETIFYDNGQWYSRYHGKNMTPEELTIG